MLHMLLFFVLLGLCVVLWPVISFCIVLALKFTMNFIILIILGVIAFFFIKTSIPFFESTYLLIKGTFNYMFPNFNEGWLGAAFAFLGFPYLLYLGYKERSGEW